MAVLTLISDLFFKGILFFALHIKSNNSFPPALSPQDEKMYLQKFKNGDTEAKNILVEHNLRLVAHITKKYCASATDQDDLISIGTVGLIKAVNTFNESKGIKLATYASKCIENEILMYFRTCKKTSQDISINEPIDSDSEGNPLTLMDIICKEDTIADDLDKKLTVNKLYKFIEEIKNEREKTIIILRYGLYDTEPLTQKQIAKMLGISRSYVSRIEKKILLELKDKFTKNKSCS